MEDADQRAILQQLAQGALSTDEAERQLAALDEQAASDPSMLSERRGGPDDPAVAPTTASSERRSGLGHLGALGGLGGVGERAAGPAGNDSARLAGKNPRVRATLSGGGLIEVLGDDAADEPRLEGPHSVTVRNSDGVFELHGDIGDDALLVVPSGADLTVEINSSRALVRGLHGILHGLFNVGQAHVAGIFDHGDSTIIANVGKLDVQLEPGSNVDATVNCAAKIQADPPLEKVGRGQWRIGDGAAQLDIGGTPGAIHLRG